MTFHLLPYNGIMPRIADDVYIAAGAVIVGDVTIGSGSSIWHHCVIRGDVAPITIGENTNIQDGTIIHVTRDGHPTSIGSRVTVGHRAMIHACTIEDESFIGMGAMILDDACVESHAMLAAGALLTAKKRLPSGTLWAGRPATHMRALRPDEVAHIAQSAINYTRLASQYRGG